MDEYRALLQENDRSPEQEEFIGRIKTGLISGIAKEPENILNLLIDIGKERGTKQVGNERVIPNIPDLFRKIIFCYSGYFFKSLTGWCSQVENTETAKSWG